MKNEVLIFKTLEVVGATKEEAEANAPFNLRRNATIAYNKWKETQRTVTTDKTEEWMKDYLRKIKAECNKDGAYIVVQTGVKDSRNRPYQVEAIKHDTRKHTPEHRYVLRDVNGAEVGRTKTKKEAEDFIKDYISANHADINAYHEWIPKENNALALKGKYTPSKGTQNYVLLVFGYTDGK